MIETNLPAIEIFQIQHDEFLFLGIENIIIGPIENSDMRTIWGNFFNSGGWENILSYSKSPYRSMVLYHKRNSETLVYFIGSIVEGINEAPNGYILAKFPSCEFLVVTHEWVSTTGEALGQIGRINEAAKKIQIPEGYIKCDNQITLIERENMNTENGSRYEFWVPIKNNR